MLHDTSINGYSGAFGYNLSNGVTIVVEATKSERATTDASAFDIFREVVKGRDPGHADKFLNLSVAAQVSNSGGKTIGRQS